MTTEKLICCRIRKIREWLGYTQDQIATEMGFDSKMSYWRIENGQTELTVRHLVKLGGVFGLTITELVDMNLSDHQLLQKMVNQLQNRPIGRPVPRKERPLRAALYGSVMAS
jgi:transcriptional regulator with XRE-family HTH domain